MRLAFRTCQCLFLAGLLAGNLRGAEAPRLADTLKEVLNRGATLYNNGDRNGCYHLFEGAMLLLRQQMTNQPELLQTIDNALRDAEQHQTVGERAWALRMALIEVRNKLAMNKGKEAGPAATLPHPTPAPIPDGTEKAPPTPQPPPPKAPEKPQPAVPPPERKSEEPKPAAAVGIPMQTNVRGHLTLDGKPLAGAFVRFSPKEGVGKGRTVKTDKDGAYELKNLTPDVYRVSITAGATGPGVPEKYGARSGLTVEVSPGGMDNADFNLKSN